MPFRAGHSRQKSDDFNGAFGDAGGTFELSESLLSHHSLSFRQPKLSCLSGARLLGRRIQQVLWQPPLFFTTRTIASVVLLCVAILIPVTLGVVTLMKIPTEVDMSLESFQIPDHISSRHQDAFEVGKRESQPWTQAMMKSRRSADPEELTPEKDEKKDYTLSESKWTIDLVYMARGEGERNMFTKERLRAVHNIEQSIMQHEGFQDVCWKWDFAKLDRILIERYNACTPPLSLVDFFFPSKGFYDGQGDDSSLTDKSISKTLTFLLSRQFTYWFVDGNFSVVNRKSAFLRAQVKFGYPLKGYPYKTKDKNVYTEQHNKWKDYMKKFIVFLGTQSTDQVNVLYGGPEVYDYLVESALWSDVNLAKYTLILIITLMFLLTSCSIFLTFFGILSILASLPLAYFFFRVVFGIPNVGILSATSLFIIIGIGVDDVFVFINTFLYAKKARGFRSRMKHTISTAAGATFFTSFTTAAAFGANCLSKMPAIHDFGLFMMLIVISCWLTVVLMIPPTLYLWDQHVAKLEAKICHLMFSWLPATPSCCKNTGSPQLPDDIQQFLSGDRQSTTHAEATPDDDVECIGATDATTGARIQLPNLESEEASPDFIDDPNSDDEDMLCLSDDQTGDPDTAPLLTTSTPEGITPPHGRGHSSCNFALRLQLWLFYLAKCVYAGRYVLLVIYLALLVGSAFLDTKITPSNKPPAFFREDTNLQQLLDLKYNMSGDNYDCKICEDIVADKSNFINSNPVTSAINSNTLPQEHPTQPKANRAKPKQAKPATKGSDTSSVLPTDRATHITLRTQASQGERSRTRPANRTSSNQSTTKQTTTSPTTHPTTGTTTELTTTAAPRPLPKDTGNEVNDSPVSTLSPTFDPCPISADCEAVEKPILDSMAIIYVVFGIKGIDRSTVTRDHVLSSKGNVIMDEKFTKFVMDRRSEFLKQMCRICTKFAQNTELVRESGADCFTNWLTTLLKTNPHVEECRNIRKHTMLGGTSHARMQFKKVHPGYRNSSTAYWLAMAFESTVHRSSSSKKVYEQYIKWNAFLKEQVKDIDELQSAFHTSEEWVHMFMEVIAVNGAIYGVVFSLVMCMVAVVIFTGHILLSVIVMLTILGVLCMVVGIFYLLGWHLGAVEAISLSILVGTSVDYCVHLVDGYIISGRFLPNSQLANKDLRGWRASAAISHIGSSILCSAITTIVAAIPLCLTNIQLFAKFGQILAINTAVSITYTLTFCVAFLTIMAPARFQRTVASRLFSVLGVALFAGMGTLILYIVSLKGIPIQGPDGSPLFNV